MAKLLVARVAGSNAYDGCRSMAATASPWSTRCRVLCDARILNIFEHAAEIQAQVVCRVLIEGRN
jgi:(2S)-methylsuccinyl-CoA dehydrogenase